MADGQAAHGENRGKNGHHGKDDENPIGAAPDHEGAAPGDGAEAGSGSAGPDGAAGGDGSTAAGDDSSAAHGHGAAVGAEVTEAQLEAFIAHMMELEGRLQQQADQLKAKEEQLDQRTRQLQRLQADFNNFRRRTEAEGERLEQRAVGRVITDLLPVLDTLERAAAADSEEAADALRSGLEIVLRQFNDFLAGQSVEKIPTVGHPFDPNWHEAIHQIETDEVPHNYVAAEIRPGYRLGDHVLSPAMVQVAHNPDGHTDEPTTKREANGNGEGSRD